MTEITTIHLKNGKTLTLQIQDFGSSPVDTEELLQVDLNNIMADIATFPVLFNRIGAIKAEIEDYVREVTLDFDIFMAQMREEYRRKLIRDDVDAKGNPKKVYPTIGEVDDGVTRDPKYKVKKMAVNAAKKEADIVDGLYWAAKSKDKKLDAISAKIQPEEFGKDILEGIINSVQIRIYNSLKSTKH